MMSSEISEDLSRIVRAGAARLLDVSEHDSACRPQPGKWSAREIIGHLIDSAANNHGRFVRAQLTDGLIFDGYRQEEWVRLQNYQEAPWPLLVRLWRDYNLHLARVIEAVPAEVRHRKRPRHNLHEIAWRTVPESQPVTLEYFMRDYVDHLEHHLRQVAEILGLGNFPPASA